MLDNILNTALNKNWKMKIKKNKIILKKEEKDKKRKIEIKFDNNKRIKGLIYLYRNRKHNYYIKKKIDSNGSLKIIYSIDDKRAKNFFQFTTLTYLLFASLPFLSKIHINTEQYLVLTLGLSSAIGYSLSYLLNQRKSWRKYYKYKYLDYYLKKFKLSGKHKKDSEICINNICYDKRKGYEVLDKLLEENYKNKIISEYISNELVNIISKS